VGGEVIYLLPGVLGFAAVATIAGTFVIWLAWVSWRRWGPGAPRGASAAFPLGPIASVLLCISMPAACVYACQPVPQPESMRTVAAFEVPLPTPAARAEFLGILSREAAAEGLTLDVDSEAERGRRTQMSTDTPIMIEASIWRGELGENEAHVWGIPHASNVWISFSRGKDRALAQRFRERVVRVVIERWPGTVALPVTPTGVIQPPEGR
jgi:hypothetical protein